jgi:hypothetical protein
MTFFNPTVLFSHIPQQHLAQTTATRTQDRWETIEMPLQKGGSKVKIYPTLAYGPDKGGKGLRLRMRFHGGQES